MRIRFAAIILSLLWGTAPAAWADGTSEPAWELQNLKFANRAQCAVDSDFPTQSVFLVVDGYNAGKAANGLAKAIGQDPAEFSRRAMKEFRLSVTQLTLSIMKKLFAGNLPLLPAELSVAEKRLPRYAALVKACEGQAYCASLEAYLGELWAVGAREGVLPASEPWTKIDRFRADSFVNLSGVSRVGCYYIKRFSPLQGHLQSPLLNAKALTEIAVAALETEKYITTCYDPDDALDSRSPVLQIEAMSSDARGWDRIGFDYWNSVKIYLSWAWRNAPEMLELSQDFGGGFRSLALEESIFFLSNGCRTMTRPRCDVDYLSANSIREFAKTGSNPPQGRAAPKRPEDVLLESGFPPVNSDILGTRATMTAAEWAAQFRQRYVQNRGFLKSRFASATTMLNLLLGAVKPKTLVESVAALIEEGRRNPAAKNEVYLLCTEFQLGASRNLDFLRSDLDALKELSVLEKFNELSGHTIADYYQYFNTVAAGMLSQCEALEKSGYWRDLAFALDKSRFQDWAKELLQIPANVDESSGALTVPTYAPEKPFLVLPPQTVLCASGADCARQVMKAMVDLYAFSNYANGVLPVSGKPLSAEAFNPYAELKACKVYDPWFATRRAWKLFMLDMASTALFGWNGLPVFISGDIKPGAVTSFRRLVEGGKVSLDPWIEREKFLPTLMADFGPLVGAPCVVSLSGTNHAPVEFYAFSGISVNYCKESQRSQGVASGSGQVDRRDSGKAACGGCTINLSPLARGSSSAAIAFNPVKLGFYVLNAVIRIFNHLNDSVNVPKASQVNPNYAAESYRKFGTIPDHCVDKLGRGLQCFENVCEALAVEFFERAYDLKVSTASTRFSLEENEVLMSAGERATWIRTPGCRGEVIVRYTCTPDSRKNSIYVTGVKGLGECGGIGNRRGWVGL